MMASSLLSLLPAALASMPPVELDARRLILVRAPLAADAPAVAAHVAATHKADVRYMMAASEECCVGLLDLLLGAMQPDKLGALATSQSTALLAIDAQAGETLDDAGWRALETRDYVLRGTADGSASLLVGDESIIELLLLRAADLEADFDALPRGLESVPAVSVLDFGSASFPWSVADERPVMQPRWDVDDAWGASS